MKRILFFAAILSLVFASCKEEDKNIDVTGVTLSRTTASLTVDGTVTLTATVVPDDATDKSVTWTSSNTATATVDNNGLVTAIAEGAATITVTTTDGGYTDICAVTVEDTENAIPVTGVALKYTAYRLPIGDMRAFVATVSPGDATDKAVTWSSSNTATATVDNNGLVTAVAEGAATITVTTHNSHHTATCLVTVIPAAVACNTTALPGWGDSLGVVGFKSNRTWTVGTQVWSDKVVAGRCQKSTFNSGSYPAYQADCRDNDDYGQLFSWPAVYRFQSELCPNGWRVPTKEDFVAMDLFLGGTGEHQYDPPNTEQFCDDNYFNPDVWGATKDGYCGNNGNTINRDAYAGYWSQSQDERYGSSFSYYNGGYSPQGANMKYVGFPLRCVRDVAEPET